MPTIDQRPTTALSFAQKAEIASDALETPASVSGYLNMRAIAAYVSQTSSGATGFDTTEVDFDGAIRIRGVVLESEASLYAGAPAGLTQAYYQDYVLYRHGTRLVYDLPEEAMRIRLGDITPDYTGFQTAPDLLGLSVQQTYAQLQPTKYTHPTGSHSFRIERPSEVDIIIDNVLYRHIRLAPGNYDLSELPLRPGANNVKLEVVDDTGRAPDLGVHRLYRRRAAGAGHQRVVFQRGRQILRSGRFARTHSCRRRAPAEFHDREQEFQQRLSAAGLFLRSAGRDRILQNRHHDGDHC